MTHKLEKRKVAIALGSNLGDSLAILLDRTHLWRNDRRTG